MTIEEYWNLYKRDTGDCEKAYGSYYFCDNEQDAGELAELVVSGKKRATASCLWIFEHEGEALPKVGDLNIITDFHGEPRCIVRTMRVEVVLFDKVPPGFAATEGEGDSSLEFWRDAHRRFFTRECASIGREFSGEMPVVCEQFEVVYK